ncbi:MBL fold metallo-hydrolase [Bacteroidota bacterium]
MLNIKTFVFNPFQENTFIVSNEKNECIVIDAGCYDENEFERVNTFIKKNDFNPVKLINTHCHIDHILGVERLKNEFQIDFACHKDDLFLLNHATEMSRNFGVPFDNPPVPDSYYSEYDTIKFGVSEIEIMHVPGHSPGSIALLCKEQSFVIVGDVLFNGSIGRTDLPGGNYETLIQSIKEKLFVLPDETVVYSGHGPETSIHKEKNTNPFFI